MNNDREEGAQNRSSVPFTVNITDALKDGNVFTYVVTSLQLADNVRFHVHRQFKDFEWLHHSLMTQEGVPGLPGVIFPPLPVKPETSAAYAEAKSRKHSGNRFQCLMGDDCHKYCLELEKYLRMVTAHPILNRSPLLLNFLTKAEPPMKGKLRKGIFDKLTQAVEEMCKEHHKDIDDYFQTEREHNYLLTAFTKSVTETFLEMSYSEQRMAVACGHLSTALNIGIGQDDNPTDYTVTRICIKLSEAFDTLKKNFEFTAANDINTLGSHFEFYSRFQDAEKEMLFRRTCKLIEVENANRTLDRAKLQKKILAEEAKKIVDKQFNEISEMARKEIQNYHWDRVQANKQALVSLTERQLNAARETYTILTKQLAELNQLFPD